jgi:hypothetical protein
LRRARSAGAIVLGHRRDVASLRRAGGGPLHRAPAGVLHRAGALTTRAPCHHRLYNNLLCCCVVGYRRLSGRASLSGVRLLHCLPAAASCKQSKMKLLRHGTQTKTRPRPNRPGRPAPAAHLPRRSSAPNSCIHILLIFSVNTYMRPLSHCRRCLKQSCLLCFGSFSLVTKRLCERGLYTYIKKNSWILE